jgi:hypothetical protein
MVRFIQVTFLVKECLAANAVRYDTLDSDILKALVIIMTKGSEQV